MNEGRGILTKKLKIILYYSMKSSWCFWLFHFVWIMFLRGLLDRNWDFVKRSKPLMSLQTVSYDEAKLLSNSLIVKSHYFFNLKTILISVVSFLLFLQSTKVLKKTFTLRMQQNLHSVSYWINSIFRRWKNKIYLPIWKVFATTKLNSIEGISSNFHSFHSFLHLLKYWSADFQSVKKKFHFNKRLGIYHNAECVYVETFLWRLIFQNFFKWKNKSCYKPLSKGRLTSPYRKQALFFYV